ncbi:MAG: hypothetical protein CO056_01880 [Candidatus Tagabacteria bacterium CG_4_9_14_0_2_um_filter_41_11]|uniref:Uncharacterized protein n=1 Tax=Candidatus Tagabacteria bacterium CG_4_9_14_0_2_um_filter_41_11 TaxID=1975019 RepID=A0A2M8EQY5_9BACT|nr:MAG: hypothetical protein CO056_01880 [Candidatus Tagabacteria bacterium CG_4_9_14_0_2_um_filter_41_11]
MRFEISSPQPTIKILNFKFLIFNFCAASIKYSWPLFLVNSPIVPITSHFCVKFCICEILHISKNLFLASSFGEN